MADDGNDAASEAVRVQSLVDAGITRLPPRYVQPLPFRPSSRRGGGLPPVLDLHYFRPDRLDEVRAAVARACAEWSSFQALGHGVPAGLLDAARAAGLAFFRGAAPEERMRYACDPRAAASEGYGSRLLPSDGGVLDWRDYFDHHTLPLSRRDPSRWPSSPPNYREVIVEYGDQMKVLAQKLLRLISESLGLRPEYIEEAVGEVYQNITISYYPPCPQPELALGLQSHSDIGIITLLIQDDVGGLEVLKDGEWVPMQPIPGAIVVILGDQTEIIINGRYKSTVHRAAVNAHHARLSVATFYDPSKATRIDPAPELITKDCPQLYRGVVYGDYLSTWYGLGPDSRRNIDALRLLVFYSLVWLAYKLCTSGKSLGLCL